VLIFWFMKKKKNIIHNELSLTANIWSLVLMTATSAKKSCFFVTILGAHWCKIISIAVSVNIINFRISM